MILKALAVLTQFAIALTLLVAATLVDDARAQTPAVDDSESLLLIEHFVPVRSIAPGMEGGIAQLHVRERVKAGTALRGSDLSGRVVLFVHGAGTPAEVAFDTPHEDYSWMAYLAEAGFDAFSVNMEGYGRSTRPPAMDDPCNLAESARAEVISTRTRSSACGDPAPGPVTTIESDWNDIMATVNYIRALRSVDSVHLVGWSLGGPRAGGFTARNPNLVDRLILLAPAYGRESSPTRPESFGDRGTMGLQSRASFDALWNRQVGCADQYDPAVADIVWREMLRSDEVGATWGPGVRRAPSTPTWGWNREVVARSRTPTLLISPVHDGQVPPSRVMDLYEDLGSPEKVLVDLGCSSHNAHWERNHALMYAASLEWLTTGTVGGETAGIQRMGY